MDMQESCLIMKLTKVIGLGICHTTQFSVNICHTKSELSLMLQQSMNKALLTDPDLLNNLTVILLQFRNDKVAKAANIEAMYHQVKVSKSDAEALRFLSEENISESDLEVYQIVVHIFGSKDSPCCVNYALKKTGRDNFDRYNLSTIESVLKSFYLNDFLKSVPSEEQVK